MKAPVKEYLEELNDTVNLLSTYIAAQDACHNFWEIVEGMERDHKNRYLRAIYDIDSLLSLLETLLYERLRERGRKYWEEGIKSPNQLISELVSA